jgi:hypothetical protein
MAGEPGWGPPDGQYHFDDGTPKVLVGELYGARSFGVTPSGWLTGVIFPKPWAPGTNKSECWSPTAWESDGLRSEHEPRQLDLVHDNPDLPSWKQRYRGWEMRNDDGESWITRSRPEPLYENQDDPDHTPAVCDDCGLHGFLRGSLSYATQPDRISGVVKAWGAMALGKRGFRAQYARIVALYLPDNHFDHGGGFKYDVDLPNHRPPDQDVMVKVRERYGLPVYRSLAALTTAHPTTPPRPEEVPS